MGVLSVFPILAPRRFAWAFRVWTRTRYRRVGFQTHERPLRMFPPSTFENDVLDYTKRRPGSFQPGRESFGRGCLKGAFDMRQHPVLCKCEMAAYRLQNTQHRLHRMKLLGVYSNYRKKISDMEQHGAFASVDVDVNAKDLAPSSAQWLLRCDIYLSC